MTVPGQIPNYEVIDDRVRAETRPAEVLAPRGHEALVAGDEAPGGLPLHDYPELLVALSQTFDAPGDRIIWEHSFDERRQSPFQAADGNAQSIEIVAPGESAGRRLPSSTICRVRPRTGLTLAMGLVAARRNLGQEHWIVIALSADSLLRGLCHELVEQLQAIESRLLVVVVDNGDASSQGDSPRPPGALAGQFDQLDDRWLSELGLSCHGPLPMRNPSIILSQLNEIRRAALPALLQVRVRGAALPVHDQAVPAAGLGSLRIVGLSPENVLVPRSGALDVVSDELQALARSDARVVAVVEKSLAKQFEFSRRRPERSYVLPPDGEPQFAQARGLALGGCRPFVVLSSKLLPYALDQLTGDLCKSRQPVTILVAPNLAPTIEDRRLPPRNPSDLAFLRLLPETIVAVPRDDHELRRLLRWSLRHAGPVAIRLPAQLTVAADDISEGDSLEPGRAEVLSEGLDVALVAVGSQVDLALRASEQLSKQGVSAGVVDARFVAPLDRGLLRRLARQVSGIVTLEEEAEHGGFGTAVLEQLATDGSATPVLVSGVVPQGHFARGSEAAEPGVEQITGKVLAFLDGTTPNDRVATARQRPAPVPGGLDLFGFSDEALRTERELVKTRQISTDVAEWATIYEQVGHRSRYLWQWCERGAELTTLPCVIPEYFDHVWQTKVLSIVLCVLLDDVADRHGQERFLDVLLQIVDQPQVATVGELTSEERQYAEVTRRLAHAYYTRIERYPCFAVYQDLLRFDLLQFFNALRYSHLLNRRPSLLNVVEHDLYLPHNMHMMSFATLDLMCSPGFSSGELGKLREAIWHAQCMGRIGNLLSSWRRESVQHDFTSGVFARAVSTGDLSLEQLCVGDQRTIETAIRSGGHERYFFRRWQHHKRCFRGLAGEIRSVDLNRLLEGHERFLLMHLGSRGLI